MKGQRTFSPMVTSVVKTGVSKKFYALLQQGLRLKYSSLGNYCSVITDNALPESTGG